MAKVTREIKVVLNQQVTDETKRCLTLLDEMYETLKSYPDLEKENNIIYKETKEKIIKGSPYIEFHPELLKKIPK